MRWRRRRKPHPGQSDGRGDRVQLGAAFVVSASFLSIMNAIGESTTFLIFAALRMVAFFWVRAKVPETKGKPLEQIQEAWAEHDEARQAPSKPAYATD
jgi:hypothetical protein